MFFKVEQNFNGLTLFLFSLRKGGDHQCSIVSGEVQKRQLEEAAALVNKGDTVLWECRKGREGDRENLRGGESRELMPGWPRFSHCKRRFGSLNCCLDRDGSLWGRGFPACSYPSWNYLGTKKRRGWQQQTSGMAGPLGLILHYKGCSWYWLSYLSLSLMAGASVEAVGMCCAHGYEEKTGSVKSVNLTKQRNQWAVCPCNLSFTSWSAAVTFPKGKCSDVLVPLGL